MKAPRARRRPSPEKKAQRHRPAGRGVTFDDVRSIALALPGVEDGTSYGTAALKVRGKLLARVHQSMDCLVLRADLLDREILMQAAPNVFFITDHYRDYPWVLMRFAAVAARELPDIVERAWRLVASKAAVKSHDARRGSRSED
jgi:hypothetical protein